MKDSTLNGKSILAISEDPQVLTDLEEVLKCCPNCTFDTATTFKEAVERLASFTYHMLVLDIMTGHSFDILGRAVIKKIPVTILTTHCFDFDALKRTSGTKAVFPLPKEKLGAVVPFFEDILADNHLSWWKRLMGSP